MTQRHLAPSCFLVAVQLATMVVCTSRLTYAIEQGGNSEQGEESHPNNFHPAVSETQEKRSTSHLTEGIGCGSLESAAVTHGLPLEFFRRLIWQESSCNPNSVSRAGALGVAQFMPSTARWRGLYDPFEPTLALNESARWLRELTNQFGNVGLAAAAYNAGPRRVKDWMEGRGPLPNETRAYVRIITGRSAEEWIGASSDLPREKKTALARPSDDSAKANVSVPPWGIQLISNGSETKALSEYAQLQKRYKSVLSDRAPTIIRRRLGGRGPSTWYLLRVAESTQARAMQLCARLLSAGGSCLVSKN